MCLPRVLYLDPRSIVRFSESSSAFSQLPATFSQAWTWMIKQSSPGRLEQIRLEAA